MSARKLELPLKLRLKLSLSSGELISQGGKIESSIALALPERCGVLLPRAAVGGLHWCRFHVLTKRNHKQGWVERECEIAELAPPTTS